eukprot:jgi/Bigna1/77455/fgenesh1_pg.48_\
MCCREQSSSLSFESSLPLDQSNDKIGGRYPRRSKRSAQISGFRSSFFLVLLLTITYPADALAVASPMARPSLRVAAHPLARIAQTAPRGRGLSHRSEVSSITSKLRALRNTGLLRPRVNQNQNQDDHEDERIRQDLKNMIPGIIGSIGGVVTMSKAHDVVAMLRFMIGRYGKRIPLPEAVECGGDVIYVGGGLVRSFAVGWLTPQIERWGSVVVLSEVANMNNEESSPHYPPGYCITKQTFFCSLLAQMLTGKLLTEFIEEGNSGGGIAATAAAFYLRAAEYLSILAIVYSAGVTTIQISRFGYRWDLQRVSDVMCYQEKRDHDFLK